MTKYERRQQREIQKRVTAYIWMLMIAIVGAAYCATLIRQGRP
jgi:hypothetical protein